jgi:hypothetical protein
MGRPTGGPWKAEPHGDTTALYADRGPNRHGLRLMNLDDGDMNFEANVRLIESAPMLLQTLIYILGIEHTTTGRLLPDDVRDMARYAVNRATTTPEAALTADNERLREALKQAEGGGR